MNPDIQKKTVLFKKDERNIFFHILTQCNLKCAHCYINPEQHGEHMLPSNTVIRWLNSLFIPEKDTNIVFLGGEPTLHPDLALFVKEARSIGYRSITVDTNGFLFHNFLDKVTPEDIDCCNFSLDGAREKLNDRIRGKGCYKKSISGIKQAIDKGFRTSVIFTASRLNIDQLGDMPDLLAELGVHRFFIQVIGIRGTPAIDKKDIQLQNKEWLDIVPDIAKKTAEIGIPATYPKLFLKPNEPFECAGLAENNFFIFPNGRVYQCPLCEDFPIHSYQFQDDKPVLLQGIRERDLFRLSIPEGCVMNKILQPANIKYDDTGNPVCKIACCLFKETVE